MEFKKKDRRGGLKWMRFGVTKLGFDLRGHL